MTTEREPFDPDASIRKSPALVKGVAEAAPLDNVEHNFSPAPDALFRQSDDFWDNAMLASSFPGGWRRYADGYKEAADTLVGHLQEEVNWRLELVYPVVFLYRQYLELAIKHLILEAQELLVEPAPYPKTHRIDNLWTLCDRLLDQVLPPDHSSGRKEIGRLIQEFVEIDPFSTAFRYPEGKDGSESHPGVREVSMRNLRRVIGKMSVTLDNAAREFSVLSNQEEDEP